MFRRPTGPAAVAAALLLAGPLPAVIQRLTPLKEVLAAVQYIFVAAVEALDPQRPAAVLAVREDLKGKVPSRRLPLTLVGDREAQREKQAPQLLDRLAPKLELVVFASRRGQRTTAFAFTNGTWFQFTDDPGATSGEAQFTFTHLEPYLRRTFKGTTAELKRVVADALADRKPPPEPDATEPPGLGPPVKK